MIAYFLLGIAVLLSFILLARWIAAADPRALAKGLRYGGGIVAVAIVLLLALSGRWSYAVAVLGIAFPALLRRKAWWARTRPMGGASAGATSRVETAMLEMTLDHDTGVMTGRVRSGARAEQALDGLSLAELRALREECRRQDPESVALIEAYLDRRFASTWRERADETAGGAGAADGRAGGTASAAMTRGEALALLGLAEGASPAEIKDAYRRLMMKLHPDTGGSAYLAAKVNQAKETLLRD
ncbi:MAG TPA: DnaJ domain-containing protein [Alphaproteobacteria bacterium]|nr:DnaJ domain-containing protein [Alphaproteobacteria bacterium]